MNKWTAVALLLLVVSARAETMWTNVVTHEVSPWPPTHPANLTSVPNQWYFDQGWEQFSLAAQADWDAARSAEAEAAEAEAAQAEAFPGPEVIAPRVDADMEPVGESRLMFDSLNNPFGTTETGSPKHTKAQQAGEVSKRDEKIKAAKAAKAKGNGNAALAERIEALEALHGY